ncbi:MULTISPECIES: Bug family tripartite tricarboxylate transporter substrate binding protein [Achromobacter]|nr:MULTISPECIES: tripartite tricarboxylate transporter substrate-binding protein [Achromobacter]CUK03552.1 Argininosuccinate lyase [Achromobacter sp. 2789STDY5608615]
MKRRSFIKACAISMAAAPVVRAGQDRVIRIIVPFAPGGSADLIPRLVAQAMAESLGDTVIVENKAGAGGAVGTLYVSRSAPDGLTLGVATVSTHAIQPAVMARPGYHPLRDFSPISNLADVPNIISINPKVPAGDMAAFIALASRPDQDLMFGSPGVGSLGHMMGELFVQATGARLRHVPYRGAGPALQDAIAGHVTVLCDNLPASLPHVQAGRLRGLAVAWPGRLAQLPDVPTFAQTGIAVLNDPAWFGLVGPAGMAPAQVARLQGAVAAALGRPEVAARVAELGAVPRANAPAEFSGQIGAELEKWLAVARKAGISLEA